MLTQGACRMGILRSSRLCLGLPKREGCLKACGVRSRPLREKPGLCGRVSGGAGNTFSRVPRPLALSWIPKAGRDTDGA